MDNNIMMLSTIVTYVITVVFFMIMLNKKDKEAKEERTDLINKLISKNTTDYIKISKKEEKPILSDAEILGDDYIKGMIN